jgi:hypothetical protein
VARAVGRKWTRAGEQAPCRAGFRARTHAVIPAPTCASARVVAATRLAVTLEPGLAPASHGRWATERRPALRCPHHLPWPTSPARTRLRAHGDPVMPVRASARAPAPVPGRTRVPVRAPAAAGGPGRARTPVPAGRRPGSARGPMPGSGQGPGPTARRRHRPGPAYGHGRTPPVGRVRPGDSSRPGLRGRQERRTQLAVRTGEPRTGTATAPRRGRQGRATGAPDRATKPRAPTCARPSRTRPRAPGVPAATDHVPALM